MIERNHYLTNTKNDIIQLKKDLMTDDTKNTERYNINSDKSSLLSETKQIIQSEKELILSEVKKIIQSEKELILSEVKKIIQSEKELILSEVKQIIKSEKGLTFEENIRGTLKYEYGLDESEFPRKVIYRIAKIGQALDIILNCENKKILINGKPYIFQINKDYSISIIDSRKPSNKFNFEDKMITYYINNANISIYGHDEIEVDGIFCIKNKFQVQMFDDDEVEVFFSNVNKKEEKELEFAVLETKLNPLSINDLISQIKRDALFFRSITNEKIVFIGFVGYGEKKKINFKDILNIKCIIYSVKTNKLCQRNLLKSIDWITVGNVIKINEKIDGLEKKFDLMNDKIDMIIEYLGNKSLDISKKQLGKKTKRS